MADDVNKDSEFLLSSDRSSISKSDEKPQTFTTSKTLNILNDPRLMTIHDQHQWQRYELFRRHEQLFPSIVSQSASPSILTSQPEGQDISEELQTLIEQRLPDLCVLDGEPIRFSNGTKFYCTVKDILTSEGEFWVERELSAENERKFRHFIEILSLVAVSYESLKQIYVGQLVALHYESSWHRALIVSKSEESLLTTQPNARVRLVDYGSSLYVNVAQLKWLPEQFYLFPFKAVECVFSEAVKPTFSDTVRLTFKQLVLNKRLTATVFDRDGTRICVLLKCKTDEGIVNVYRYLRAHEHRSKRGRMLADGEIVTCLRNTILNNTSYLDQSIISNITLPTLTPPSPIKLTRDQLQIRRAEIKKIVQEPSDVNNQKRIHSPSLQSTPISAGTVITPLPRLSFVQQ